ncbi:protein isoform X1 [Capsicum chacoense]|nr:putative UDP-glycosyltransferase 76F1-like [Capsicum annuum]
MPFDYPAMQMVPSLMREENKESDDYEPKVVSLGPYHHGKHPKLKFVEDFKPEAVKMFIEDKNDGVFMHAILRDIGYAKSCYLEKFTSGYSDEVFARMMLQDACLILNYIGPTTKTEQSQKKIRIINQLGTVVYTNIRRDMYLLENQVPFYILKILVSLKYGTTLGDKLLEIMETYCFKMFFPDKNFDKPDVTNNEMEPPHILEIFRRVIITGVDHESTPPADHCCDINNLVSCLDHCCFSINKETIMPGRYVFRSVMDLKSKGIDFRASGIKSLKGVRFSPTKFCQSAMLKLPRCYVTMYTRVFFMNMIAYEISPNFFMPKSIIAYVSFMKLLVVSKEDVKELREKEIIINSLGSDEQVVELYNALNTYEADDSSSYYDVKMNIEEHYNSKVKMWMAGLKENYFNNPWSIIALVGSVVLLILTILQTYYAGHDTGDKCCSKGKFHLD